MGFNFFVLGYITKSTVMICPSVKICDFLFFFFTVGVSIVSVPRWRHVEEAKKEKKKKKKKRGHRLDTGVRRLVPVSVSYACRTLVRRQKWRVGAT